MSELADPAAHGFDAARLARIGAFLEERYLAPGLLPHADLLIARDGVPFHRVTLGQARTDGMPLAEDAIFRMASMTKALTSTAFMMLVEEGKIALDDPVTKVLPEFAGLGVYAGGGGDAPFAPVRPATAAMRMVDLLTHMSGLTYGIQSRTNVDAAYRKARLDGHPSLPGNDHFIAELAKLPLEFDPGMGWNYSVSTDVLGVIVARLSGMSLGAFFEKRIFEPLGMVDTGFHCPPEKAHRLTDSWYHVPVGAPQLLDVAETSNTLRAPRFESGGGGLLSTTADYHRFCAALVNGGAPLISPKTLALMTANHLPGGADLTTLSRALFSEAGNAGIGFGLGFGVVVDPAKTLVPGTRGEFHWGGIHSTAFFVDPAEGLHMVFMTQLFPSSTYPIRRQLKTLIYAAMAQSRA